MPNIKVNLRLTASFAGVIYDHLKKLILDGELKPNQRITVQEFAKYFNVSITPVREAFQRLLADNYLSSNNRNRNELRVISLSLDEVNKIFELTGALDIYGMKKSLQNFPEKAVHELKKMNEILTEYYKKKYIKSYLKQNLKIHYRIWQIYDNEYIYQTLVKAQERISLVIGIIPNRFYTPSILKKSHTNHCELMEAIENRDMQQAEEVLQRHWEKDFFCDLTYGDKEKKFYE
jgi:DNA-binding GntR family transcriptional regulator